MTELLDQHQRVAHEQIARTQEYVRNPRVALMLGETVARRMVLLSRKLYVPDIADGNIVSRKGGIPVVSLAPGERISHNVGLTEEQRNAIRSVSIGTHPDMDHLESLLGPRTITLPDQAAGMTLTQKAPIDVGQSGYELQGSPAIVLNTQRAAHEGYSTTVLPHELVHAGQALRRPIRKKTGHGYMQEEALAYNIQSKLLLNALGVHDDVRVDKVHSVSQAYEAWKQEGLSLNSTEEVDAFSDMLQGLGISPIHPKQAKK